LRPRRTSSIDQNAGAGFPGFRAKGFVTDTPRETDEGCYHKTDDCVDEKNGSRHFGAYPEHGQRREKAGADQITSKNRIQIRDTDEATQAPIEPRKIEDRQLHQNADDQRLFENTVQRKWNRKFEAKEKGGRQR